MRTQTVTLNGKTLVLDEAELRRRLNRKVTKADKADLWAEDFCVEGRDEEHAYWEAKATKHRAAVAVLTDALAGLVGEDDDDVRLGRLCAQD